MAEAPKSKNWINTQLELILDDVRSIREEQKTIEYRQFMANKYATFFTKFPSLLMKLIDDGDQFDRKQFEVLLKMMNDVHEGRRNMEETNTEFGQQQFNQYVKPHIDEEKEVQGGKKKNGGKWPQNHLIRGNRILLYKSVLFVEVGFLQSK